MAISSSDSFYTLGGSLEHYSLVGVQTSPRAGFSFYALRPRSGVFSGTRIQFNFGDAVREPKLTDQDGSLYNFLLANGGQSTIQQLKIGQLAAPYVRTYEGGVQQSFLSGHIIFTTNYFHNQFGREIEYVGLDLIPQLLPNLTPAQQQQLASILQANFAYELALNSEAYRAQGIETSIESGIGKELFFRGGYTYLDAVVQRSFTNDDAALLGPIPTFSDGTPIGPYSPLKGARPFRRPPHTGFFTATWSRQRFTAQFAFGLCQPERRLDLPGGLRFERRQQPAASKPQSGLWMGASGPGRELSSALVALDLRPGQ